jgi:type I restriction enzyme S subunit
VVVPADWKEVRLGEHAAFFKGNGLSKSQLIDDGPQQCVHYGELFTHYGPVIETVTSKCVEFEGSFRSLAGDVLMPGSDVTPRGLATASAIKVSDVVLGGDVIVIRTKPNSLHGPFLSNFIRMSKGHVLRLVKGSTVYHIHAKDLADFEVLVPPLKEQEAIAEVLSDADAAIETLDALIAKKRDVKQATMQQVLTGRTRLPGFTADWKEVSIGSFTGCKAGGTPSTSIPAYWGGDIRWMSSGELNLKRVREVSGRITQAGIENSSAQFFPADSVLIGLAGQGKTRGTAAINLVGLTTNQSIAAILPSASHDSKFLFYVMETKYKELRDLSDGGGGRGGLNLTIIKDIRVTVPELGEQEKVSEILWSMDDELDALSEQVLKLRMVKEGMMQDLLTGKVRLV